MNTTAIQNRNECFFTNAETLGARKKTVYKIIESYGKLTAQEIKEKMVLGVNQISGRLTELSDLYLIKESGSKFNEKSDRPNTLWEITTPDERIDMVNTAFINLRSERDTLINDLNLLNLSQITRDRTFKRVRTIDKQIFNLENI